MIMSKMMFFVLELFRSILLYVYYYPRMLRF